MAAMLLSTGIYLPKNQIRTSSITPESWTETYASEVVGIRTIPTADEHEHASDLAVKAGLQALRNANIEAADVDVIIYCGLGVNDHGFWSPAAKIQYELQASRAFAFDVYQGCVNTFTALKLAKDLLHANQEMSYILVVTSSRAGEWVAGRTTGNTFYSDGGAAAVVGRSGSAWELGPFFFETNGYFNDVFFAGSGGTAPSPPAGGGGTSLYGVQNLTKQKNELKPIFLDKFVRVIETLRAQVKEQEVYVNLFNYNNGLLSSLKGRLNGSVRGWLNNVERFGHMGPCDPLLNLHLALENDQIPAGAAVINVAAGIGMSWGGCTIERKCHL